MIGHGPGRRVGRAWASLIVILAPAWGGCLWMYQVPAQGALQHAAALRTADPERIEGHLAALEREMEGIAFIKNHVADEDLRRLLASIPDVAPYLVDPRPRFRLTASRILHGYCRVAGLWGPPGYRSSEHGPASSLSEAHQVVILRFLREDLEHLLGPTARTALLAGRQPADVESRLALLAQLPLAPADGVVRAAATDLIRDEAVSSVASEDPYGPAAEAVRLARVLTGRDPGDGPMPDTGLPPPGALPPTR